MKKNILFAVLVASSFTLFSFRGTTETKKDAEISKVNNFSIALKNFTSSAETFPDKFTRWRKDWVDYSTLRSMNVSLDEMNKTLEKY